MLKILFPSYITLKVRMGNRYFGTVKSYNFVNISWSKLVFSYKALKR